MLSKYQGKIKTLDELKKVLPGLKKQKKKIVLCHGVFDLMHLGHIRHFNSAKKFGDILVVTTTADRHVKRGPGRPVFRQDLRAEALANLAVVDYVCVLDHPSAAQSIEIVKPDFYVKGPDYVHKDKDVTGKIYEEEKLVKKYGGNLVFTDDLTFSSSQLLNNHFEKYPEKTLKYLKKLSARYSVDALFEKIATIEKMKILVIGDTIIDQYHYCLPLGKSSKDSIIANKFISGEDFAGGSLATANHVAQLSKKVDLLTILGENYSFEKFIRNKLNKNIKPVFFQRKSCVTTVKRRYVNHDNNRKLFEICALDDQYLNKNEQKNILTFLKKNIKKYDLVIVSDFGHGLITKEIINLLCAKANCLAINVQTNSANMGFNLVTKYPRADLVCIDQLELRLATGEKTGEIPNLLKRIHQQLHCKMVIATKGSFGSLAYTKKDGLIDSPAFSDHTVDAVGAGDAFYSYVAPCFASGMKPDIVSLIGNAVGSLKVQIVGNREPVKMVDLMKFVNRLLKF